MNILIATSAHYAGDTRITYRQAQTLSEQHTVFLLAQEAPINELPDTIQYHFISSSTTIVGRIFKTFFSIVFLILKKDIDILLIHDPELIPLILLFDSFGITCVVDHHENYRALAKRKKGSTAKHVLIEKLLRLNEAIEVNHSSLNIAATKSIEKQLPKHSAPTLHFPNYAGELDLPTKDPLKKASECSIDLIYIGYGSEQRGVIAILDIVCRLKSEHNFFPNTHIAGEIRPENELMKAKNHPGWSLITYHGFTHREKLNNLLSNSKIGLCPYLEDEHHIESMPNKIFEYAWKGCAIVSHKLPQWKFIEEKSLGLLCDFTQTRSSTDTILRLLNKPQLLKTYKKNAYNAARKDFTYSHLGSELLEAFDMLSSS